MVLNAASDMMPGGCEMWLSELSCELHHSVDSAGNDVTTLFDVDSARLLIPLVDPLTASNQREATHGPFDLPRPNGRNQYQKHQRQMGLVDDTGKLMWLVFECNSSFQRAWCRFGWKNVEYTWPNSGAERQMTKP